MPRKATSNYNAVTRIKRELLEYSRTPADHVLYKIETVNGDVTNLTGHIFGPTESPFEGGIFGLSIAIPSTYPFNPPKVKFTTRVWHPNVSSQTGAICLDILKDTWAASLTLRTVMLSLTALLTSPEADDPQDAVVARQYKEMNDLYKQTAAYWTHHFATPKRTGGTQEQSSGRKKWASFEEKIQKVLEKKHCPRDAALSALSCANWDVTAAINSLS